MVDQEHTGIDVQVYRTGGLRWLNDHWELVFRGRRESMLKHQGYRIELREIEGAATNHAAIHETCAVPMPNEDECNEFHPFLLPQENRELPQEDGEIKKTALFTHFLERGPRYMLTTGSNVLDALPKISTGKIDRPALAKSFKAHL